MNTAPCVSAIVPARNEERTIGRAVASLAEQPEIREIIVVNDQSSDGTGEILRRLAAEQPKLRVVDAGPLPPGWVGKNHAAWLGAEKAACDWLLFTDADAVHLPGSTARALADAESSRSSSGLLFSGTGDAHLVGASRDSFCFLPAFATLFVCGGKRSRIARGGGQRPILADSAKRLRKDRRPCGGARGGAGGCGAGSAGEVRRLSLAFRAGRPDLPRAHVLDVSRYVGGLVEKSAAPDHVGGPAASPANSSR